MRLFLCSGVFRPVETLSSVRQFISSCLLDPSREYKLVFLKTPLNDSDLRLAQIGLVSYTRLLCFEFMIQINKLRVCMANIQRYIHLIRVLNTMSVSHSKA